jgi:DNA uptake protein ComE-like DNA-binding protein
LAQQLSVCALSALAVLLALAGCGPSANQSEQDRRQRDEKTREEVAKATERAKPEIQAAGRALGRAAETAVEDAHAAAQGIREGWNERNHDPVNLNSATEEALFDLPGIGQSDARRIIEGRPYQHKHELVTKGILSESAYAKIRDNVTIK